MATTTFSGPIRSGTILNTTGTTLGTDVRNVGAVPTIAVASTVMTHATTTATATGLIVPKYSQITRVFMLIEQLFANSSTTTISFGDGADNAVDITAAANVAAGATGPMEMVQSATDRWQVGANDIELYGITIANSATAGQARVFVEYLQNWTGTALNSGNRNPLTPSNY